MGAIYGSSYYTIVDGPSWTVAEEQANALGGNLASIGSADENQYISRSFKDANKVYYGGTADQDIYWIGLNKRVDPGNGAMEVLNLETVDHLSLMKTQE